MKNLVVVQEFIDKQHTRYRVGEKISAERSYADLLLKKDLVDEVFTEKELKEFAEAEKAKPDAEAEKADAEKAKPDAESKKVEAEKPKKEKAK